MKTIVAGEKRISRLLGKQKIRTDNARYRCMKYVLRTECADGILLHNVITGHLVLLNEKEELVLNNLPITASSDIYELIEDYFLVPEEFDEKTTVMNLRILMNRLFRSQGISLFTILTTTNCNARCFYCYEKNLTRINMDEKTAYDVADYISTHKIPGKINLNWFGGEPLVCSQRIDQICKVLRDNNIEYMSTMTSNGYLFDQSTIEKAVALWRLTHIQITLDGRRETYNRIKAYVINDKNPYDRVISNIELLLKAGIHVTIRLNFDQFNLDEIKELANELKEQFGYYKNISVYAHFILEKSNELSYSRNQQEEDRLIQEQISISEYLAVLGLKKPDMNLPRIRTRSCAADGEDSIVIYPDGRFYECIEISEEDCIGSLSSPQLNDVIVQKYQDRIELNTCSECPLYPTCILLTKCPDVSRLNQYNCENKVHQSITTIRETAIHIISTNDIS